MQLKTPTHRQADRWLAPLPSALDSPQKLVLASGASEYADNPTAFAELAAAFPRSVLVGGSTSGEIAGSRASDAGMPATWASTPAPRSRPRPAAAGSANCTTRP